MRIRRQRVVLATVAALATAAGATLVLPGGASGDDTPEFLQRIPAGHLSLATAPDGSGSLSRHDADGALVETIDFDINDKCKLLNATELGGLLNIAPVGSAAIGLVNNGLGVRTKNTCSPTNGRLDQGQAFIMTLGAALQSDSLVIDYAELDIEGKFGASLISTTDANAPEIIALSASSDNGPDSGPNDNNAIPIGTSEPDNDFVQLRIEPVADGKGEIGLDGGGDYQVPADHTSIFHLVQIGEFEYSVDCGDTFAEFGTGMVQDITFVRNDNEGAVAGDECLPIGASINGDSTGVQLGKTTTAAEGTPQAVQARLGITWLADGSSPNVEDELLREVDFLDGSGFQPVPYCVSYIPDPLADPALGALDPDHPGTVTFPANTPWCLISDQRVLSGGLIVQTQIYSGAGDPNWR
jgi:hypothetical protein